LARASRQAFPYKNFPSIKDYDAGAFDCGAAFMDAASDDNGDILPVAEPTTSDVSVPSNGNQHPEMKRWTQFERDFILKVAKAWSRWEVDPALGIIKSSSCEQTTANLDGVCNPCRELRTDESLRRAIRRVGLLNPL
jgi:hypothetical protein